MIVFLSALLLGLSLRFLLRRPTLFSVRRPWLFLLALGVEASLALLAAWGVVPGRVAGPLGQVLVYTLLFVAFLQNLHLVGMRFAALGALFNALVIAANGGHMPVFPEALERAGLGGYASFLARAGDGLHVLAGEGTRLGFLGDWIVLPGRVVSPGDLLLVLGLFSLGFGWGERRVGA